MLLYTVNSGVPVRKSEDVNKNLMKMSILGLPRIKC